MAKTYSTKEASYSPGDTVKRVSTKTSIENVLGGYDSAVLNATAESYNPSAKLGPQGQRKAQEFPKAVTAGEVLQKIQDWSGDVKGYVTPVERGVQTLKISLSSGHSTTYRYSVEIDADIVHWEV